MSNRTLIEINHDLWHKIKENPLRFAGDVIRYLGSGSPECAEQLERYGLRVFGMRHHSDEYEIKWGGHEAYSSGKKKQ